MVTNRQSTSRLDEARKVAQDLLDSLESSQLSIEASLMKAKRLARLMRDTDAQVWLDLETRGYPSSDNFNFSQLGTCIKYAIAGGRVTPDGKYYVPSLPQIEARCKSDEAMIQALRSSRLPATKAKDFLEKSATEALLTTHIKLQVQQKEAFAQSQGLVRLSNLY